MVTSTYRLGDLVKIGLKRWDKVDLLKDHPDSIGAEFIQSENNENYIENQSIYTIYYKNNALLRICKIVQKYLIKYKNLLPPDIENSTVIHLRLGDAVAGQLFAAVTRRPLDTQIYKEYINKGYISTDEKIYIIGKCHFGHINNYDECVKASNNHLNEVKKIFNATYFNSGNADIDLCCAVKCKKFVQGRGNYSDIIVQIRKFLGNNNNIEIPSEINEYFKPPYRISIWKQSCRYYRS